MPSKHTFTIKPIQQIIEKSFKEHGGRWIDPYAGWNSPAHIRNDLNPEAPTEYHMPAAEFCDSIIEEGAFNVLLDPPYSVRQLKEVYNSIGLKLNQKDTQNYYAIVRDILSPKMALGSLAISFGWNSTGFSNSRGFEKKELLIVNHGGMHHDTLVLVEVKTLDVYRQQPLFEEVDQQ